MDRKTAIEWVEQIKHRIRGGDEDFDRQRKEALDMAIVDMKICDANNAGWISVRDRLPNCNGIYLVWRPHYFGGEIGEPVVCYFDGQNTWHDSYGVDFERILNPDDVTHWMPLPEPPKEET